MKKFLAIAVCPLLFVCCNLFNNNPEGNILKAIDADVAWANAEKVTVTVAYPQEWGSSPQFAGCFDASRTNERPRSGYPFPVEFTPSSGYGFVGWLAFDSGKFTLESITAMDFDTAKSNSLNGDAVDIGSLQKTNTGAMSVNVTINSSSGVILVPWCDSRPRLAQQTNPPLTPVLTAFPFDQRINIWFTMPINPATVILGQTVNISGIYAAGDDRGKSFRETDLNGVLDSYFDLDFPSDSVTHVTLTPKTDTAPDLSLLTIIVTVGPGIESASGTAMAAAETISYQTDTNEAQKVYSPGTIRASVSADGSLFYDAGTQWNNPDIDRRFNQNSNTVFLHFSVTAPEGAPSLTPNRITVTERRAFDLRGFTASGSLDYAYTVPGPGVSTPAGGGCIIAHQIQTTAPGIIQLIVLPWYNDAVNPYQPLSAASALSEGQYVTIVMDNAAPELPDMGAGLGSYSSFDSENGVYIYGSGQEMSLTLGNLGNLVDNGSQGGIPASQAWSLPWTMDDIQNLFWYVQIGDDGQAGGIASDKLGVYNGAVLNNTWSLPDLSALVADTPYPVYVKFEDSMGNGTAWKDTGFKVMYSTEAVGYISDLNASCNTTGNQITVNWTQPADYQYPELVVRTYRASSFGDVLESEQHTDFNKQQNGTYSFGVPQIDSSGVMDGNPVSGVYGYEISVIAHNVAGNPVCGPIWIYNIPGMATTGTGTGKDSNTIRVADMSGIPVSGAETTGKNYVLTGDSSITGTWIPRGSGSGADAFQGKFYGNGHTVTFTGDFGTAGTAGIFGYVSGRSNDRTTGAYTEIHDLCVYYPAGVSSGSGTSIGGFAGYVQFYTKISNCIVKGDPAAALRVTCNTTSGIFEGGMFGQIDNNVTVTNGFSSLNADLIGNNAGTVRIGGACGGINDYYTGVILNYYTFSNINVTGNVTCNNTNQSAEIYAGGVTGSYGGYNNMGYITNLYYSGTLTVNRNSVANGGNTYCGGIAGLCTYGTIINCEFKADGIITIPDDNSGYVDVGGISGRCTGGSLYYCSKNGNIDVQSGGTIYAGGIAGYSESVIDTCLTGTNGNNYMTALTVKSKQGSKDLWAGGIAGYAKAISNSQSSYEDNINVTIFDCTLNLGGCAGEISGGGGSASGSEAFFNITNANTQAPNADICIGGFAGKLSSGASLNLCSSDTDIYTVPNVTGNQYIGGLVGYSQGTSKINQCRATGYNGELYVASTAMTAVNFYCGGLVGFSDNTAISSSFATYTIETDFRFARCYTGGLVGYANSGSIMNCYGNYNHINAESYNEIVSSSDVAAGGIAGCSDSCNIQYNITVAADYISARRPGTGAVCAGGIVGKWVNGAVSHNVALCTGTGVAARGGGSRSAGRIYGSGSGNGSSNYAINTMLVRTNPGDTDTGAGAIVLSSDLTSLNGKDAAIGDLRKAETFWLDTVNGPGFNMSGSGTSLDDLVNIWDFSVVSGRGYPKLAWE